MSALRLAIAGVGGAVAFLDAVGGRLGLGPDAVSGPAKERAEEIKGGIVARVENVAVLAVGNVLNATCSGVALDPVDPFSDSSVSQALSAVAGVQVSSVADRDALRRDMRAGVTQKINERFGLSFSNLFDRAAVRADIGRVAGESLGNKVSGLALRDLNDKAVTVEDVQEYTARLASGLTGVSFSDFRDSASMKEAIYLWAMPQIQEQAEGGEESDNLKPALMMDEKHVKAREAQRRFRASVGRNWEYQGVG